MSVVAFYSHDSIISLRRECVLYLIFTFWAYLTSVYKGNNKITEHRAIFQRERQNSQVNKQIKSVNNRKTGKTAMAPTWYRNFQRNVYCSARFSSG
jgi:hypothetical protein